MLLLGILGVVNAFEHSVIQHIFGGNLYWSIKRSIMPIALIGAGVYMLSKSKKEEAKNTEDIVEIEEETEEEIEAAE